MAEFLIPANASERTAIKGNILLSRIIVFLAIALVGQGIYHDQNPIIKEHPVFIEFQSSSNNFVKIAEAGETLQANRALVDASIRRYLVDRERVDKTTEEMRYQRVMAMSSDKVSEEFRIKYGADDAPYKSRGQKREIEIVRSDELVRGIYQIEYKVTDTFGETQRSFTGDEEIASGDLKRHPVNDKNKQVAEWVATIGYDFKKQLITYDKHLMNPLGLFVENFSLSRRKEK
ncbi:MAG: hypothetical protein COC22_00200 [Flavobacteriaceae bacterium]|nr:MAG: hypothetical protein COC22_00200 [Flavobacteriaceae bacterium]